MCSMDILPKHNVGVKQGLLLEAAQRQMCSTYSNTTLFLFLFNFLYSLGVTCELGFIKKFLFSSIFYFGPTESQFFLLTK